MVGLLSEIAPLREGVIVLQESAVHIVDGEGPMCHRDGMASTMFPGVPVEKQLAYDLAAVAKEHRAWAAKRDRLIVIAVARGGSLREVGALVGLSHAGVKRIVERAK